MKVVNSATLKEISVGKDKVKVTTEGGGEWELSPQDAAKILDHATTLPKGRKVDLQLMQSNRIIFDRLHKEALSGDKPKRDQKQAIEQ
ncbi:hypothetical protein Ares1_0002 [Vibrio phage Ares1]|nr:hypothetical protein Ares1_0002 [Vibrio phage Ares1]